MHATLSPAKADLVQVARAEEALSRLARQAAGKASYRRSRLLPSDFSATPLVPAVDPTMRSVSNGQDSGVRKLLIGLLVFIFVIAGLGAAATWGWRWYSEATQQIDSSLPPHPGDSSAELIVANPPIGPALPEQASASANVVDEAAQQSPPAAQTASDTIASAAITTPSPEATEQLQAMAHDLASLRQRVEQLTAGQEQMNRTLARLQASERDIRRRQIEQQVFAPASKPLPPVPAPQTQQLLAAPTSAPPPPRPPEGLR